jgi:hypothetical protein
MEARREQRDEEEELGEDRQGEMESSNDSPEESQIGTADLASPSASTPMRSEDDRVEDDEMVHERDDDGLNEKATFVKPEMVSYENFGTLLPDDEGANFSIRWEDIQASFVDEPRKSVQSADQLVAEVMQRLAESFARERSDLEQQWDRGEDVSTEDLRVALQRYRSFFQRLLAA